MGRLDLIDEMLIGDTIAVGELTSLTKSQRGYLSMYLDVDDVRDDKTKERLSQISKVELTALWASDEVKLYVDKAMMGYIKTRMYPKVIRWASKTMESDEKQQKFGVELLLKLNQVLSHDQPQLVNNVQVNTVGDTGVFARQIAEEQKRLEMEEGRRE